MEAKNIKKTSELAFDDETGLVPQLGGMFSSLLDYIAKYQKLKKMAVESLTIADDDTVHKLNLEYRGVDRTTDVISFAFMEAGDDGDLEFMDLGDLIVSLPQAQRQADEFKHPLCRELAFLFIHGTLHNLGYDHTKSDEDARVMYELQNNILNGFQFDWENEEWKPKKNPLDL